MKTTAVSPIVSYSFHHEDCMANHAASVIYRPDSGAALLGALIGTVSPSLCVCGLSSGLRETVQLASSSQNISVLSRRLIAANPSADNEQMSIELWLRPRGDLDKALVLFSVGPSTAGSDCSTALSLSLLPGSTDRYFNVLLSLCGGGVSSGNTLISPDIPVTKPPDSDLARPVRVLLSISSSRTQTSGASFALHTIAANFTVVAESVPQTRVVAQRVFAHSADASLLYRGWTDLSRTQFFPAAQSDVSVQCNDEPRVKEKDYSTVVLHRFALYDKALSADAFSPIPFPASPTVWFKNTETVCESGDNVTDCNTASAAVPLPIAQLRVLCASVFDLDKDSSSPSFRNNITYTPVYLSLSQSKVSGALYFLNGTSISLSQDAVAVPYETESHCHAVRLRPLWGDLSESRLVFTALSSSAVGVVRVIVNEVPRPPNITTTAISAIALNPTTIPLNGTVYSSRVLSSAIVTAFSLYGNLSLCDVFTANCSLPLSLTDNSLSVRVDLLTQTLAYTYSGPETLLSLNDTVVGFDSLSVSLCDDHALCGTPTQLSLTIHSALSLTPLTSLSQRVTQDESLSLCVRGDDSSAHSRALYVRVERAPAHGVLYAVSANESLSLPLSISLFESDNLTALTALSHNTSALRMERTRLHTTRSHNDDDVALCACVLYVPHKFFFTHPAEGWRDDLSAPSHNVPDSFSLSLALSADPPYSIPNLTVSSHNNSVLYTNPLPFSVSVQNINDPATLDWTEFDGQTARIYALGSNTARDATESAFVVSGLAVRDRDLPRTDLVRVVAHTTRGGLIQLNDTLWKSKRDTMLGEELFFEGSTLCEERDSVGGDDDWESNFPSNYTAGPLCEGDFFSARERVSFLATTYAAERVLNGLRFVSVSHFARDTLTIELYDGAGGECPPRAALCPDTIYTTCFYSSVSVNIEMSGYHNTQSAMSDAARNAVLTSRLTNVLSSFGAFFLLLFVKRVFVRMRSTLSKKFDKNDKRLFASPSDVEGERESDKLAEDEDIENGTAGESIEDEDRERNTEKDRETSDESDEERGAVVSPQETYGNERGRVRETARERVREREPPPREKELRVAERARSARGERERDRVPRGGAAVMRPPQRTVARHSHPPVWA